MVLLKNMNNRWLVLYSVMLKIENKTTVLCIILLSRCEKCRDIKNRNLMCGVLYTWREVALKFSGGKSAVAHLVIIVCAPAAASVEAAQE